MAQHTQTKNYFIRMTRHIIVTITCIALITGSFCIIQNKYEVNAASAPTATAKVNASGGAVLRKSASTSSSRITILKDNTNITVKRVVYKSKTSTSATNRWYYVTAGSSTGYIRADLVDSIKYSPVNGTTNAFVYYRAGAGTKMKQAGSFNKGTSVQVCLEATPASGTAGSSSVWYIVKVGSKYYSSCSSKINLSGNSTAATASTSEKPATTDNQSKPAATDNQEKPADNQSKPSLKAGTPGATGLVNSTSGVNLRKTASTSGSIVKVLDNDTPVVIEKAVFTSKTDPSDKYKWYYVNTGSEKGYIQANLIDNIKYSAASGKVTGKFNYRSGAGTSMKLEGSLSKGKAITIYLKATPVSGTAGSNSTWYLTKVGSKFVYVCSTWVDITGSIFVNNTDTVDAGNTGSTSTGSTSTNSQTSNMSDADFDRYLDKQGFPASYKTKLKELHKSHPNWVFVAYNTGINWNSALNKESANGVSLVHSSLPLSYRATDSNSYKGTSYSIYKTVGASSASGKIANGEEATLISETWDKTTLWSNVKLKNGTYGFIKGQPATQRYETSVAGVVTSSTVNIRKGAGTANSLIKSLKKGNKVDIVLSVKDKTDGATWYKIKNGSGYAYVKSSYIKVTGTISETVTVKPEGSISGVTTTSALNVRAAAGTNGAIIDTIKEGTEVVVLGKKVVNGENWYSIAYSGKQGYSAASYINTNGAEVPDESAAEGTVTADVLNVRDAASTSASILGTVNQGTLITIKETQSVNGEDWYSFDFDGKTGYVSASYIDTAQTITAEATQTIEKPADPSKLTGTVTYKGSGSYIPKDGSTWFNADKRVVAYYMDPRNFLNEDRVYMFEDLSYKKEYQTTTVVSKILSPTKLPQNGFSAKIFVNAGSTYGVSPVHLASRARQETGGGSIAITGYKINGKTVYNPFNIGASSGSNPVLKGLNYAYNKGWYTQTKAVNGGASYLSSGYISKKQNSVYFQRFNVANGLSKVATHQYMTNITAPYSEAYSTKTAYKSYGITNESLTFIIPVFTDMPSSTTLP